MISQFKEDFILENGTLYDPVSDKKSKTSVLISDGLIIKIGKISSNKEIKRIDCEGKFITPGFLDLHTHFREPGREDKETLETGSMAAMVGGFTRVCVMPNTNPPLDSPESIRFILEKSKDLCIQIYPIGAITKGQKGKEITEIGEMVSAGAVAISDDGLPVQNGQVMRYAVEYAKMFDIPVINHAEDICLRNDGIMNESALSTRLGLIGNPVISESTMIYRDLEIAEFTNGKIHIPHVSTGRSVEIIRKFKSKGVQVTAEVTPHHLGLTEDLMRSYDANAKVAPPLRTDWDRMMLIEGVLDGTIDCIATDHAPHTIEEKEMDIMHSPCGMIGLESAFGLVYTTLIDHGVSFEKIIKCLTIGPSLVLGLDFTPFSINKLAEICIVDLESQWTFKKENILSRSKNSPMIGMNFTGRISGVISGKNSIGINFD